MRCAISPRRPAFAQVVSYYYALVHPKGAPYLRPRSFSDFAPPTGAVISRVAMCLRAEEGARIADKTVLKMMREMAALRIRREEVPQAQLR